MRDLERLRREAATGDPAAVSLLEAERIRRGRLDVLPDGCWSNRGTTAHHQARLAAMRIDRLERFMRAFSALSELLNDVRASVFCCRDIQRWQRADQLEATWRALQPLSVSAYRLIWRWRMAHRQATNGARAGGSTTAPTRAR